MSYIIYRSYLELQIHKHPLQTIIQRRSHASRRGFFGEQFSFSVSFSRNFARWNQWQRDVHFIKIPPPRSGSSALPSSTPDLSPQIEAEGDDSRSPELEKNLANDACSTITARISLPTCPGCGAKVQKESPQEPGFFGPQAVKREKSKKQNRAEEDAIFALSMQRYEEALRKNIRDSESSYKENSDDQLPREEGLIGMQLEGLTAPLWFEKAMVESSAISSQTPKSLNLDYEAIDRREDKVSKGPGENELAENLTIAQAPAQQAVANPPEFLVSEEVAEKNVFHKHGEEETESFEGDNNQYRLGDFMAESLLDKNERNCRIQSRPSTSEGSASKLLCQRCVGIVQYNSAVSFGSYLDLNSLVDLILVSPYKKNHIYHLIDAADFPLSLVPNLYLYLVHRLPEKLARNLTISYVVTRADLLMPKENQATSLMTYIKKVLKDALPPDVSLEPNRGKDKVRLTSARHGWAIGKIKDELKARAGLHYSKVRGENVCQREGGVWIVGKVNVGKSRFMAEICPEGSFTKVVSTIAEVPPVSELVINPEPPTVNYGELSPKEKIEAFIAEIEAGEAMSDLTQAEVSSRQDLERILQPVTRRQAFESQGITEDPHGIIKPTVSHIPGTTVAPIRVAFRHPGVDGRKGRVRGEIIDLPGFERGRFLEFVRPDMRKHVTMEKRVKHQQFVLKPGLSLLLGGLIVVRPVTEDVTFLVYPFTTLSPHLTTNEKLAGFMSHPDPNKVMQRDKSKRPILWQYPSGRLLPNTDYETSNIGGQIDYTKESGLLDEIEEEGTILDKNSELLSKGEDDRLMGANDADDDGEDKPMTEGEKYEKLDEAQAEKLLGENGEENSLSNSGKGELLDEVDDDESENSKSALADKTKTDARFPEYIKSAGMFALDYDVTLLRNPKLQQEEGLSLLPYRIYSRDILLEGIGWLEVIAQVRTRKFGDGVFPIVEVLSPLGEGVGSRAPMGADTLILSGAKGSGEFSLRRKKPKGRPRSPKKGHKKNLRLAIARLQIQSEEPAV